MGRHRAPKDRAPGEKRDREGRNHEPPPRSRLLNRRGLESPHESISVTGHGLDEPRRLRIVPERRAELGDTGVQARVEVDESIRSPERAAYLFAVHSLARPPGEKPEDPRRLRLELDLRAALEELVRVRAKLEDVESNRGRTASFADRAFEDGPAVQRPSRSISSIVDCM
jgi:hypothetical protein